MRREFERRGFECGMAVAQFLRDANTAHELWMEEKYDITLEVIESMKKQLEDLKRCGFDVSRISAVLKDLESGLKEDPESEAISTMFFELKSQISKIIEEFSGK
ncbi:MAG: hypothetical protein DRP12_00140 [Candidatus Aenigmatarchaeota archaeon]|nr:MAG: hypothetical protein DRP12_00140 [Candidatus Aenigmarchaeota archaeon]